MDDATRPEPRRRGAALAVGIEVLVATAGTVAVVLLSVLAAGGGRTDRPPWSAPADVEGRAAAAGLTMLGSEGVAMHLHEHLSITVDGRAVTVPAHIGIDTAADRYSPIHTHDTTGILHVESPVVRTFHLGQAFTEWDVALGLGRIGAFRDGRNGVREAVFLDGERYAGDPTGIALGARQDIDFVVTTDGSAPTGPSTAFRFPAGY